ncbi:MAG: YfiR family protein [Gammaproteobacteria bacterium]
MIHSCPAVRCLALILVLAVAGMYMTSATAETESDTFSEDQVKAAFLLRFPGYVDWPSAAANDAPFTIAVMGDEGVAEHLRALVRSRPVKGREVRLQLIDFPGDAADAQLLFVGRESAHQLPAISAVVSNKPVLVVADVPDSLTKGAIVNFLRVDRRVQFEISLDAAEAAGLRIMPELLSVARRVMRRNSRSDAECEPLPAVPRLMEECGGSTYIVSPDLPIGTWSMSVAITAMLD